MGLTEAKTLEQTGGVKELLALFFSVLLISFSTYTLLLIEKLFLARVSAEALEIVVSTAYFSQIFQAPCVALAMMAQVYVGRWIGAGEHKSIGPGVWQFIWFSVLSACIIFPVGWISSGLYFHETALSSTAVPYSRFLIAINFLYPLGTTLSCFYLGQGKTLLIVIITIASQLLKLVSAYLLIFGWGWIPCLGLMGGAISTVIAQGGFCLFLLMSFLSHKHKELFDSHRWRFQLKLFWNCIHPGLLRAINRILNFICWVLIARLVSTKGGDHLLSLSIGGALFLFLPFLGDALCQAQTTVVSQILGAKNFSFLNKPLRSGALLVSIMIVLVGIPLLFFPSATFNLLFPTISLGSMDIQKIFLGIWLSFVFFTLSFLPISYILAFKDTRFSLFMGFVAWINGFLFMYLMIKKVNITADFFWITLSIMHLSNFIFYWARMRWLQSQLQISLSLQD
jgi:MATE family multidrug resistance protein